MMHQAPVRNSNPYDDSSNGSQDGQSDQRYKTFHDVTCVKLVRLSSETNLFKPSLCGFYELNTLSSLLPYSKRIDLGLNLFAAASLPVGYLEILDKVKNVWPS